VEITRSFGFRSPNWVDLLQSKFIRDMPTDSGELYLEDIELGRPYQGASVTITLDAIRDFAREYDPQVFHLDEEAAKSSVFGELVASGWMTAPLSIRMGSQGELNLAGGWIGLGVESLAWPNPVRPGDVLTAVTEVLEKRASKSKPTTGIVKLRTTSFNQDGMKVCEVVSNQLVQRRAID
jgi:acyl dehydratase